MSPVSFTESVVEEAALAWLGGLGWQVTHGPEIAQGEPHAERTDPSYRDVILDRRLRDALTRLNPRLPAEAIDEAFRKLARADAPSLVERNRAVHRMLVDGVAVEYRRSDGSIAGGQALVIDFDRPDDNDWLAVNQFTVSKTEHTRRPDIVLFVNGLALGVIELKNAADENATIWTAFQQLVKVLGEPTPKDIARELVIAVKSNVPIDWTVRENVRAQLRVIVKRILRKYGYPPDKQEKAT